MHSIIIIPARLGSTRLPNKILELINGTPMIVKVAQNMIQNKDNMVVYVACDEQNVSNMLAEYGINSILTKREHNSGTDRIYEALQKIEQQEQKQFDYVINVQGDLPTLNYQYVSQTIALLKSNDNYDIATMANQCDLDTAKDPNNVKPIIAFTDANQRQGRALYFTRAQCPAGIGEYYHHIGVYAYRRQALESFINLPPSNLEQREKLEQLRALENNINIGIHIIDHHPVSVDTAADLELVRAHS